MRCLCGIIPPSAGEIKVCGISMIDDPVNAKRMLAFVPAEPRFFPYLTVWEHMQMFSRMYGCGEQLAYADKLLDTLVLREKRDHLPSALSRGMQQKLMIACALIHKPRVMVFDEPFTGLDPLAIRKIREILREQAEEGASILISSHLLAMVEDMVDRVLIIQSGQTVVDGKLEDLLASMPGLQDGAGLETLFLHATSGGEQALREAAFSDPYGYYAADNQVQESSDAEESVDEPAVEPVDEPAVEPVDEPAVEGGSHAAHEEEELVVPAVDLSSVVAESPEEIESTPSSSRWLAVSEAAPEAGSEAPEEPDEEKAAEVPEEPKSEGVEP
jgi:ABC-2 type transport system ATP-binding protein